MIKKGCFLLIFTFVFIIGVGYYLWQKYNDDIFDEVKKRIVTLAIENLNDEIFDINENINADSLKNIYTDIILDKVKNIDVAELNDYMKELVNKISNEIKDHKTDLRTIEEIIKSYER